MSASKNVLNTIKDILQSSQFKTDLEGLSAYACNIKQENPIMILLAKYYFQKNKDVILEWKQKISGRRNPRKTDLVIEGIRIEAKFFFEFDIKRIKDELEKLHWDLEVIINKIKTTKPNSWSPSELILNDIFKREPEIFILIFWFRDIPQNLTDADRIVDSKYTQEYIRGLGNFSTIKKNTEEIIKKFFDALKIKKIYQLHPLPPIIVNSNIKAISFSSEYYFYLLDFT